MSEPRPTRPTFDMVYRTGAHHVARTLRRMGVQDRDLEDAVHDVFMIVLRRLPEYEPRGRLTAWLGAIAVNVAAKYRASARRSPVAQDERRDSEEPGHQRLSDVEVRAADRDLVLRLLEDVEPERRAVLVMHEIDDVPIPEVASALAIPEGTAYTRLRAARHEFERAHRRMQERERSGAARTAMLPMLMPTALLQTEGLVPPMPADVFGRIWSRLSAALGFPSGSGHAGPADTASPVGHGAAHAFAGAKLGGALAGALALGAVLGALLDPLHRQPSEPVVLAAEPSAPQQQAATAPTAAEATSATAAVATSTPSSVPHALPPAEPDAAAERALLTKATSALASGDSASAIGALQEHARRFPRGVLAEEREVYWISALLRAGRRDEARGRVERLARSNPNHPRLAEFRRALTPQDTP